MRRRKSKHGHISKIILKGLITGTAIVAIFALPGLASVVVLFSPCDTKYRYRIKQSATRLENRGLITTYLDKGILCAKLTTKGRREAEFLRVQEEGLPIKKKWSKKWYVVLFDIPEKYKSARVTLTQTLKSIGFYPLQKSVFIYPHDCKKEVSFIIDYFNIKEYVQYVVIEQMSDDTKIRRFFKLSST
ncbi:MAG: hypothetical protein ISR99_02730 [Parcubacteria group bacterium]|nr:hypothetical protein [Parcubacteria group bacterium]